MKNYFFFLLSSNKHLLSSKFVPDTVHGTEGKKLNKAHFSHQISYRLSEECMCKQRLSSFISSLRWHPTPVFLPGESQGQGSLVGCCLCGHTESDTSEAT